MLRPHTNRSGKHAPSVALTPLALALLLGACASPGDLRDIERFRATHPECNPRHFIRPCQIGPDGKLYEYLPGETDRR